MVSNGEPLDLEVIKARVEAATPGPWRWADWRAEWGTYERDRTTLEHSTRNDEFPQLMQRDVECTRILGLEDWVEWDVPKERANAEFIAAARSDVPALLAEVEFLRCQVAEADGAIVQLVRRVEVMDELFRRAQEWREMRRGSPTKPKPESAALILAVDALSQPVATKETD